MNPIEDLKNLGYLWMYAIVGATILAWIIHEIKDTAFQNGYWKGRSEGWQSHRRLVNTRIKSDEVFDYDKN
jgi:formate/nitrite transporter FocA (FNT family)